jgi:flagellar biosynthetic protein FliO
VIDSLATGPPGLLSDGAIWRSLGMLLLVLALLVGAVWLLRRLQRGTAVRSLDLEVLGRLPIAQKQFLSVVRVGKDLWVLGVSERSIQYLGDYHGDLNEGRSTPASPAPVGRFFEARLKSFSERLALRRSAEGQTVPK